MYICMMGECMGRAEENQMKIGPQQQQQRSRKAETVTETK